MINLRDNQDSAITPAPAFHTVLRHVVDVRHEEVRILCIGCLLCRCFVDACEADDAVFSVGRATLDRVPFFILRECVCPASALRYTICVCKLP